MALISNLLVTISLEIDLLFLSIGKIRSSRDDQVDEPC